MLSTALSALTVTSCKSDKMKYDATGTFEATEVTVTAEQTGKLLSLSIEEGDRVNKNEQVGLIDTVQLYLKARQIGATKLVYDAQKPEIEKQLAALRQQLDQALRNAARFDSLVKEGAANSKQLDDARDLVAVTEKQIEAQTSALNNSRASLNAQIGTADVQQLQVADMLLKCRINSPIDGIVTAKYAEAGEFASTGKPLFKVADIDNMRLRAYVSASQLNSIKIGQAVTVFADYGESDSHAYEGRITWISSKAEFTPKTIQTRDERANLVYAIKISIKNDGLVKDGMYGEVKF